MKTTIGLGVGVLRRCFLAMTACAVSVVSIVFAQERPPIENLGASSAVVEGDWLAYSQWESFDNEDLNGDGDTGDEVIHVRKLSTSETTNLRLAGVVVCAVGEWLVLQVGENAQGKDLNGDGDAGDLVVHVHNLASGQTTNLRLFGLNFSVSDDWLVFDVSEVGQGKNLNGNGRIAVADLTVHIHRFSTGETTNLGLAGSFRPSFRVSGHWLALEVSEANHGVDLNGDGDTLDSVFAVHNITTGENTNLKLAGFAGDSFAGGSGRWLVLSISELLQGEDLNGDGDTDDSVVHLHDVATGETTNLRLAGSTFSVSGDWLAMTVSEQHQDWDLNGDGDTFDNVVAVHNLTTSDLTPDDADYLGLCGIGGFDGNWLVVGGDTSDEPVSVYSLRTEEITNLGLVGRLFDGAGHRNFSAPKTGS